VDKDLLARHRWGNSPPILVARLDRYE
jgi:hypothetical protein